MGHRPGARPLPAPGRGAAGAGDRLARHPVDADRIREVAGRDRGALRRPRPGPPHLLHRPAQGAGEREVLRAGRGVRLRQRRHDDRRLRREPGRADHLLHRGDPGQPGAAPGPGRGHRPGRDGRVPLLRRPAARLGVAGAAAGAAARPVPAHVGDARRRVVLRRRPRAAHRRPRRRRRGRRAAGAADVLLRGRAAARAAGDAGADRPLPRVRRALHAEGGRRARAGAAVDDPRLPGAARPDRRRAGRLPVRPGLRQDAVPAAAARRRRAPRGHAAQVPPGRRAADPEGPAPGRLRHRHPSASGSTCRSARCCSPRW